MTRQAPISLSGEEFRRLGHQLVDELAAFIDSIPRRPVTAVESPSAVQAVLPDDAMPEIGGEPSALLSQACELMFQHSLLNGHPRFAGYVTAPAAPLATLAELLASNVNPNLGAWILSPIATEIERQTIRWIADLVGYPRGCGGLLVSGGNMANFVGFLVARRAKADWPVREQGLAAAQSKRLRLYASPETHTWLHKAADLFGLGTDAIHWVATRTDQTMDADALRAAIKADLAQGEQPFLVIGTAGTVSTGAVDPISALRRLCDEFGLWLHLDGAYGAFAAAADNCPEESRNLALADSVAMDPHKWLYMPLEAGCVLVKDPQLMRDTFSYRPPYYKLDEVGGEPPLNYVDYSPQNSRGFRALKIWLSLRHMGRQGYAQMIGDDMRLAQRMFELAQQHPELDAASCHLSITCFRYRPPRLHSAAGVETDAYLNRLNEQLLTRLQESGLAFVSNAVIESRYLLRACIVNFRTDEADVQAILDTVVELGRQLDAQSKPPPD